MHICHKDGVRATSHITRIRNEVALHERVKLYFMFYIHTKLENLTRREKNE